jgi:hypothetical protein
MQIIFIGKENRLLDSSVESSELTRNGFALARSKVRFKSTFSAKELAALTDSNSHLIAPHGGELINLVVARKKPRN